MGLQTARVGLDPVLLDRAAIFGLLEADAEGLLEADAEGLLEAGRSARDLVEIEVGAGGRQSRCRNARRGRHPHLKALPGRPERRAQSAGAQQGQGGRGAFGLGAQLQ